MLLAPCNDEERARYAEILAAMPPVWACSNCSKVTPKPNRRGDLCSRCAAVFDEHEGGQLRLGCEGDQLEVLPLADERVPESDGPALASPELEQLRPRFITTVVSLGAAGLAARPAVWDRKRQRTVHSYRCGEEHLAEAMAAKLNEELVRGLEEV